jgi:hypothetical protein
MTTIRRMGEQFAADRTITVDEAKALVDKAKANGIVSNYEKYQLRNVVSQFKDMFAAGALDVITPLISARPPPNPGTGPGLNLDPSGAHPPVFLTPGGVLTTSATGAAPLNDVELGDALFRGGSIVDDLPPGQNLFARSSVQTRTGALENLQASLSRPIADPNQAKQIRASAGSIALHLLEASPEPDLRASISAQYEAMVRAEPDARVRETMIFHLSNSPAAKEGPVKELAGKLMEQLAPTRPPYEKWFANGNKTVNLSWTVGQGEFWKGFTGYLKNQGFKPVGAESSYGVTTYEKTVNKPGVGDTTFRISVREGGPNILEPMNDPNVQIVGYDGHSNWGRNMTSSVKNGPTDPANGDGKLLFYNLCVGKGVLDKVREKYPDAQVATTYAASNFYTDASGQMTRGEGVQALMALVDGISTRADWTSLHRSMNAAANIGHGRTWDNYVTPISTLTREKVLDRDNDGQADYLDRQFNYNTFKVADDTAREFTPIRQERPAGSLDGTKVLIAANMVNTLSEFSGILDRHNPDSRVLANGWFDPKMGDKDVVKFAPATGSDGKPELHMSVSSRYAHMSEEALRATTVYELNRYLGSTGQLRMDPVDVKLAGVLVFAQSMSVDEGYRDREIWSSFLNRYSFPPGIDLSAVSGALAQHSGHNYAGDTTSINALKAALPQDVLAALTRPEVGEPISIVG